MTGHAPDLVLIASRLALAVVKLRELAAVCPGCRGKGATAERFECFLLTDDERHAENHAPRWRARASDHDSRTEKFPRAVGLLLTDCAACLDLRQVIETVGGLS